MTDPFPNDPLKTLMPGEPAPPEVIERYRGVVPEELVNVWETHGFGTTVGGFVRFVDPGSLTDIVEETFERSAGAVPPSLLPIWSGALYPVDASTPMDDGSVGAALAYIDHLLHQEWTPGAKYFYGHRVG